LVIEKCIWMEAGVVEYQLCPLKKNCEICDFHQEMIRGTRSSIPGITSLETRCPDPSLTQFTPGLQYLDGHFWYKHVGAKRIRLGIDIFLWQLFASTQKVVFPQTGGQVQQDSCFCWLILSGGMAYLKTPVSGTIMAVNPRLDSDYIHDSQLLYSPENELWLIELEVGEDFQQGSLIKDQYLNQIREEQFQFEAIFMNRMDSEAGRPDHITVDPRGDFRKYLQKVSRGQAFIC